MRPKWIQGQNIKVNISSVNLILYSKTDMTIKSKPKFNWGLEGTSDIPGNSKARRGINFKKLIGQTSWAKIVLFIKSAATQCWPKSSQTVSSVCSRCSIADHWRLFGQLKAQNNFVHFYEDGRHAEFWSFHGYSKCLLILGWL